MTFLKNYKPTGQHIWQGRIDDPADSDSFRWHQVIETIDLSTSTINAVSKEKNAFCFLGFCCDEGVRRNIGRTGTSKAPLSIRKEITNLPCYFGEKTKLFDAGNIFCIGTDLETAQRELTIAIKKIFFLNMFPIILGGGHEIALSFYNGITESISKNKKKIPGIINFDAHFDLRPYHNGGNSGTMFLQIADQNKKKNINFSYFCIGIQKYGNTVSLFKKADDLGVKYLLAKDIDNANLSDIYEKINGYLKQHDHIYLTLCTDVFSAAYAPGVSAPQPFGLLPEIGLKMIKHIVKSGKVIGFDVAEVSPRFDEDNRTAKLAAIIIFAIINTLTHPENTI